MKSDLWVNGALKIYILLVCGDAHIFVLKLDLWEASQYVITINERYIVCGLRVSNWIS